MPTKSVQVLARVAGCLYRISDRTIILISYKRDKPIKKVVVMTTVSPKDSSVKDVFSVEDSAVWPVVIQVLNPELSADQRANVIEKAAASVKDSQANYGENWNESVLRGHRSRPRNMDGGERGPFEVGG